MADSSDYSYRTHPLYGRIRLRKHQTTARDGKSYEWWEYDPTYAPPVPANAIPGRPSDQVFCAMHNVPKYFYVDEDRVCIECGQSFVFEAQEQKYWYETLKFNLNSIAIRCRACRKAKQSERSLNSCVAAAREAIAREPDGPTAYLDLAESLVR